jgi:CRP-like cAMP-binding protein/ribosomal protein S18 acetylase RimI-like enzyme
MSPVPAALLASFPLFAACGPDDLEPIASRLEWQALGVGEEAMHEGEGASDFAVLLEGEVLITRRAGTELLATAGPGAILGELALLRGSTRTATVTAGSPCQLAVGGLADLEALLLLPGVHDQIRDVASARLARDVPPVPVEMDDGTVLRFRPIVPSDRVAYAEAIGELSAQSLRRRFFTGGQPSAAMIDYLLHVDYIDHFVWVAFRDDDPPLGVATGRYNRSLEQAEEAEIALAVVDSHQGRGIGKLMMGAIAVAAANAGVDRLVANVLEDNAPMRALLRAVGAKSSFEEPGVIRARYSPEGAIGLLRPGFAEALDRASRDIVTAAGLALT